MMRASRALRASRATRAMALALLAGCFGGNPSPDEVVYEAHCTVFATCGPTGDGQVIEVDGTEAEVSYVATTWVDACATVTHEWVVTGRCAFVWCGAFCDAMNGGT